jgi:hypothetical protein
MYTLIVASYEYEGQFVRGRYVAEKSIYSNSEPGICLRGTLYYFRVEKNSAVPFEKSCMPSKYRRV